MKKFPFVFAFVMLCVLATTPFAAHAADDGKAKWSSDNKL